MLPPPRGARDLARGAGSGLFGGAILAGLLFSLQVAPAAVVGVGGGDTRRPGGAALFAQVPSLFLLAYVLVARARGVLAGQRPYALDDLAPRLLRACLVVLVLLPSLTGALQARLVAAAVPLLVGAATSELPSHDLAPRALWRAAARSDGPWRAMGLSCVALGPALMALVSVQSPLALWRPPTLTAAAVVVVGTAAGLSRRAAEARR